MEKKPKWIYKDIVSSESSRESSKVYTSTDTDNGKSELIIEKTITERYPMEDYDKVMDLHDRLHCGSGRKLWTLEEIAHPYNPKRS